MSQAEILQRFSPVPSCMLQKWPYVFTSPLHDGFHILVCLALKKGTEQNQNPPQHIWQMNIYICHHSTRVLTPTVATLSNHIQPYPTIPNHRSVHIGLAPKLRLEIDMAGDVDGPEDLVHQVASSSRDWHPVAERR